MRVQSKTDEWTGGDVVRTKKNRILFFAAIICVLLLFGCGQSSDEIEMVRIWPRDDGLEEESAGGSGNTGFSGKWKIGIVTDDAEDTKESDDSFKQSAKEGLIALKATYGIDTAEANTGSAERFSEGFGRFTTDDIVDAVDVAPSFPCRQQARDGVGQAMLVGGYNNATCATRHSLHIA